MSIEGNQQKLTELEQSLVESLSQTFECNIGVARELFGRLLVELKWNKSAETALRQIKAKKYPDSIRDYTGSILLVGINYDEKTKAHECSIERYDKE